jgi:DNA-binding NarL/FixJ family response regulator
MQAINIVIVDDQGIFRQILSLALSVVPQFVVIGEYANGTDFLEALPGLQPRPDVALVDIDMPMLNGIALNSKLQEVSPEVKVIMLSQHTERSLIAALIKAGAAAYLDKDCRQEELITAIQTVYTTGYYFNKRMLDSLSSVGRQPESPRRLPDGISSRELEILRLICQELTNAEIAERLFISQKTVDFHRSNLLSKTNSRNVAGLVVYAVRNGLIKIA